MKKLATLSFALVALASISWASSNLNSSRSNAFRLFYNDALMSQAQADALLADMDKTGSANEAKLNKFVAVSLEKHGVKPGAVVKTIIRPPDKTHPQTTIILLIKGDDEAAAITASDRAVPSNAAQPSKLTPINPSVLKQPVGNRPLTPRPPIKGSRPCMDPAAQSLTFQVISRGPQRTEGRIRLTAVVKNVGGVAFVSDPRQATAALYETPVGGRGIIRAQQSIARLEPNATITLTYECNWSASTEFPPNFALLISYDPDIYIDANKNNDDCGRTNNKKDLAGDEINRRW